MIKHEWYDEERNLVIAYSDEDCKIQKVGTDEIYDDAVDVFDHIGTDRKPRGKYSYKETDIKKEIPKETGILYTESEEDICGVEENAFDKE